MHNEPCKLTSSADVFQVLRGRGIGEGGEPPQHSWGQPESGGAAGQRAAGCRTRLLPASSSNASWGLQSPSVGVGTGGGSREPRYPPTHLGAPVTASLLLGLHTGCACLAPPCSQDCFQNHWLSHLLASYLCRHLLHLFFQRILAESFLPAV